MLLLLMLGFCDELIPCPIIWLFWMFFCNSFPILFCGFPFFPPGAFILSCFSILFSFAPWPWLTKKPCSDCIFACSSCICLSLAATVLRRSSFSMSNLSVNNIESLNTSLIWPASLLVENLLSLLNSNRIILPSSLLSVFSMYRLLMSSSSKLLLDGWISSPAREYLSSSVSFLLIKLYCALLLEFKSLRKALIRIL